VAQFERPEKALLRALKYRISATRTRKIPNSRRAMKVEMRRRRA